MFSTSENAGEDADQTPQGLKHPSTKDDDIKLKPARDEQPGSETEDASLQGSKSKLKFVVREHDTGNKDDSIQHAK
jgi:hypothetical protein